MDPEHLNGHDLTRVFVAATMAEARQVEAFLTERDIDYVVQAEALSRTLFGSPRYWAAFYVAEAHARACGAALTAAGLDMGVVVDEDQES
jgi:hypothetical protein